MSTAGCLFFNKKINTTKNINISASENKIDEIKYLHSLFNSGNKLQEGIIKKDNTKIYTLHLTSAQMCQDLDKNFGITYLKYKNFYPSNKLINSILFRHFLRGALDGSSSAKNEIIRFSGTETFILKIKEFLFEKLKFSENYGYIKKCRQKYELSYFAQEAVCKIINFLYSDSTIYISNRYKYYICLYENILLSLKEKEEIKRNKELKEFRRKSFLKLKKTENELYKKIQKFNFDGVIITNAGFGKENKDKLVYEIYMHTNKINGKIYIGYTKNGTFHRWKEHIKKARSGSQSAFHLALMKYGPEPHIWKHEVLEEIIGVDEANKAETKWVAYYKSNQKGIGYNLTEGGNSPIFSEKTLKKMSEATKAQMTPERRERMSKNMKDYWKDKPNPFLGKTHTEESLKIMSEKHKKWIEENGNPFSGKTHSEEVKTKMKEAAQRRVSDPNWVSPFKNISAEQRRKNGSKRVGCHPGKFSQEN